MKITHIKTWQVPPRWLFLKIETDEGISGWGEPVMEGRAATVEAAVQEFADVLIGRDPRRIEDIWQTLYRGTFYRGGPILMSAIAGIDQALWDIKGKALGVPVHELLGGAVRDKMRMYCWIGGDRPADVGRQAREVVAKGFTAFKMNGTPELAIVDSHAKIDDAVARVAEAREAVGRDVGIAIDFHGRVHRPMAKVLLRELEPFHPMFVEEPVLPEHLHCLPQIASGLGYPIATGERLFNRSAFRDILEARMVDIVQPDVSHCGGLTEARKIATLAETYDVALAPHCPLGPLTLATSLHLDFVSHNAFIQEQSMGIHYNRDNDVLDYLVDPAPLAIVDGYLPLLDRPGLGVEIDEAFVEERAKVGHRWRNPNWRHADGSVAEW
ncbi:galactonate dehydratase [Pinisolibacter aquiterrae]|jgi:galactonate dehydratase|uniref:galactonate dehydratase n=1 Tax=Pinisolibacter aquiterrae TaxID=2815579 RepID=UPI001C3D4426|nr:galactonate dehydratase [Pinisolibacter aquiterrae]MBV5265821.1 galactonate dehydratase [Pinisolibacter aquiterrae]MCC8236614.1 galactonate dehydratase [Pinisolibacter aquiterrae]